VGEFYPTRDEEQEMLNELWAADPEFYNYAKNARYEITAEQALAAQQALITMLEGKYCIHCRAPIERKEQVGRCVYARPCGHRQYQGEVNLGTEQKS